MRKFLLRPESGGYRHCLKEEHTELEEGLAKKKGLTLKDNKALTRGRGKPRMRLESLSSSRKEAEAPVSGKTNNEGSNRREMRQPMENLGQITELKKKR